MFWAMNLKGHKVFQFGRLGGLKKLLGEDGLVFLAYVEMNIFTC